MAYQEWCEGITARATMYVGWIIEEVNTYPLDSAPENLEYAARPSADF